MAVIIIEPINATFIHIPKTGGNSISLWLHKYTKCIVTKKKQHASIQEVLNGNHILGPQTRESLGFTFCVVRNPWDWAVSWYSFNNMLLENKIKHVTDYPDPDTRKKKYKKFNLESLLEARKNTPSFEEWLPRFSRNPQSRWATGCDYVFKLENINNDFKLIQEKINCFEPLSIVNKSITRKKVNYKDYYTSQKSIDIISDRYQTDIKNYGYDFEG